MKFLHTIFKPFVISCIIGIMLIGCGHDPADPPYDTEKNPSDFPQAAVVLLDEIETGQLSTLEEISNGFANLYTSQSDLLDNQEWRDIITRLGGHLGYRADSLSSVSPSYYKQAADLYMLASFARPKDEALKKKASLFSSWSRLANDGDGQLMAGQSSINDKISILKRFSLADSAGEMFAREYLFPYLNLDTSKNKTYSPGTQMYLAYAGIAGEIRSDPVVVFGSDELALFGAYIDRLDSGLFRAELYFKPLSSVKEDYTIVLKVTSIEDSSSPQSRSGNYLPLDLYPAVGSSTWIPGKLYVVTQEFRSSQVPTHLEIGLRTGVGSSAVFLPVNGKSFDFYGIKLD